MLKTNIKRRDFMLVTDITDGNPNGDPDNGGGPRQDESGYGKITTECTKRKGREAVFLMKGGEPGFEMFIERGAVLNMKIREAYVEAGVAVPEAKTKKGAKAGDKEVKQSDSELRVSRKEAEAGTRRICERYFDARWFGGVITGVGSGRITGPLQINIGKSVEPIDVVSMAGTRCATTNEEQSENQKGANQNWVRRGVIPYAVFTQTGHLSPFQADKTGFTEEDWQIYEDSLKIMYENDHSSSRGLQTLQQAVIFEHADPLGNARAADLFKLVKITRVNEDVTPRSFDDYRVFIDRANLPPGVTVRTLYPETPAAPSTATVTETAPKVNGTSKTPPSTVVSEN